MKNEFIPYEEALALKELGFDEPCVGTYHSRGNRKGEFTFGIFQHPKRNSQANTVSGTYIGEKGCYAPLYQQAFRWFREKYKLLHTVNIDLSNNLKDKVYIYTIEDHLGSIVDRSREYNTYQEAELACLRNIIEIVNQNKDE